MQRWPNYLLLIAVCLAVFDVMAKEPVTSLPEGSRLVSVGNHQLHLREKGVDNEGLSLLLLSGPTDNWHSDSAWWILGQNYLAENYRTVLIDRAGQGWSDRIETPSYQQFALDLETVMDNNDVIPSTDKIIVVAFASSNLAVNLLLKDTKIRKRVAGVVLIDPDVLTAHSIDHYTTETEKYKQQWDELKAYIESGQYDQRVKDKLVAERNHLKQLVPESLKKFMDWSYYDQVEKIRKTRDYQSHKFLETTAYLSDLNAAKQIPISTDVPIVILDTDFEAGYLSKIKDEAVRQSVSQWRKEGVEWYFNLAERSTCGFYWPVDNQEHLLMMTRPDLIKQAVKRIMACSD